MGELTGLETVVAAMLETAPNGWWRYVPCPTCRANRGEPCLMGGWSWPSPARNPHAQRLHDAHVLHRTIWLLTNGHTDDVLTERTER